MRSHLAVAPVWVVAVVSGVFFGVFWTGATAVQDHRFGWHLLLIGVVVGAMFGVWTGFGVRRQRRRTDHILDDLSAVQRRAVSRAVATGTPPEEPALRAAAVAMAHDALTQHTRTQTATIATCAVLAAASTVLVIDSSWYLGASAVFIAMIVATLRYPVRLRRRIAILDATDTQVGDRRLATQ
jgi:type III secretory pathway component EscS